MEVNIVFIFIVSITNNLIAKLTTLLGCEISENKFTTVLGVRHQN